MPQTLLRVEEVIAENRLDGGPHLADADQVNIVDIESSGSELDWALSCHKLSRLSRSHC